MKLSEGDKIEITGGLPDTEAGIYWVAYISYCHGHSYYGLRKFYGRKIVSRFFTNAVDAHMGSKIRQIAA